MKQVRETAAAKALSAYIVLNPRGEHCATVQVFHGETCRVDVWSVGDRAHDRNMKALGAKPNEYGYSDAASLQQGRASGGGYDKFTAALQGMYIDGVLMFDHCGQDDKSKRALAAYHKDKALYTGESTSTDQHETWTKSVEKRKKLFAKQGLYFSNGDSSLYYRDGLNRLRGMGYRVINAL